MTDETASLPSGPLVGLRVVELAGMGPGPYCAMLLSDLGADVVRVERPSTKSDDGNELLRRGRRSVMIDVKTPKGLELVLDMIESADALLDPYRPGAADRLGVGPDVCLARNPRLVYGRMTGWGQDGPLAGNAGHDINYIALGGALAHIGRAGEPPVPPMNLVGDMGGGGLFLAFGMVCALLEAQRSGQGQIVDMAMIDGVASLMTMIYGYHAQGHYSRDRGVNVFDGGAPFYDVYECADGKFVSIGPIEFRFYARLMDRLGLAVEDLPPRRDRSKWAASKTRLASTFKSKTRQQWCDLLEADTEVCFAPVLDLAEAPLHPHHAARHTFLVRDGVVQPAPTPRFSRTPGAVQRPPAPRGAHTDEVLGDWLGVDPQELSQLHHDQILSQDEL